MAHEEPELPHDPFPPWARYVEAAIPVSLAIAVSHQHDALVPPAVARGVRVRRPPRPG